MISFHDRSRVVDDVVITAETLNSCVRDCCTGPNFLTLSFAVILNWHTVMGLSKFSISGDGCDCFHMRHQVERYQAHVCGASFFIDYRSALPSRTDCGSVKIGKGSLIGHMYSFRKKGFRKVVDEVVQYDVQDVRICVGRRRCQVSQPSWPLL